MTEQQIRAIAQTFGLSRDRFISKYNRDKGLNLENYFFFDYDRKFPNGKYKPDYIEICTLEGEETIQLEFGNITNKESIAKMKQLIHILENI